MSKVDAILNEAKEAPWDNRAFRDKVSSVIKQKYGLELKDWRSENVPGYGECMKLTLGTPQAPIIDLYVKESDGGRLAYINMEVNLSSRAPNPAGVVDSFPKF